MHIRGLRLLAVAIVASILSGCSGSGATSPAMRLGLHAAPRMTTLEASTVSVPMCLVGELPVVEVSINGAPPLPFIVDSGAAVTVMSADVAAALDLPRRSMHVSVAGGAGSKRVLADVVTVGDMTIGAARFGGFEAVVWHLDTIRSTIGLDIAGIIGFPVFSDCLLTMNYPASRLELSAESLAGDGHAVSMSLADSTPVIDLHIGARRVPVTVDTGAASSLYLSDRTARGLTIERIGAPSSAPTVTGEMKTHLGHLSEPVRIGPHVVDCPRVTIASDSLLGSRMLQLFEVSFDQRAKRVRFALAAE